MATPSATWMIRQITVYCTVTHSASTKRTSWNAAIQLASPVNSSWRVKRLRWCRLSQTE